MQSKVDHWIDYQMSGYLVAKRVMDIICASVALVVLSPVLLVTAIAVKLTSRGPVLFKQTRVGKDGNTFKMLKFRSMVVDAEDLLEDIKDQNERDGPVFKMQNDPRITSIGHFIREHCIDELPQLFNILGGSMSIVGPRPAMPREVEDYEPWQRIRLDATPGLTCFWQCSNESMTFHEWVESDIAYISQQSILLDIKLILNTIPIVLRGHK